MEWHNKQTLLLGIGGSGMRGLAHILAARGAIVYGTDDRVAELAAAPDLANFTLWTTAEAEQRLADMEVLVYTDATEPTHPLRQLAQEQDMPAFTYHAAVGVLTGQMPTVAVAGTHGKSSTTAMLAHILVSVNRDPTVLLGAPVPAWNNRAARIGTEALFVLEADEYRDHFLAYRPEYLGLTTLDFDHPDYFTSATQVETSYQALLTQLTGAKTVVTHAELVRDHPDFPWPSQTILAQPLPAEVGLPVPGEHMRQNAAIAVGLAETLGVTREAALASMTTFSGIGRRFERLGYVGEATLVSDYGHHPTEIAATIAGARHADQSARILVVWEPHTIERVRAFFTEFVAALATADGVIQVPVFVPRGREGVTSESAALQAAVRSELNERTIPNWLCSEYAELPAIVQAEKDNYSLILAFTAGSLDSYIRTLPHLQATR